MAKTPDFTELVSAFINRFHDEERSRMRWHLRNSGALDSWRGTVEPKDNFTKAVARKAFADRATLEAQQ